VTDAADSPTTPQPEAKESLSARFLKPKAEKRPRPAAGEMPTDVEIIDGFPERQVAMRSIGSSEIRFGYAVAILGAIFTLGLNIPSMTGDTQFTNALAPVKGACTKGYTLSKGTCLQVVHYQPADFLPFLIVGLVAAAAIALTVRLRRRTPTVFASLMMGLVVSEVPPKPSILLGVPFFVFSGWLMIRARRLQKFGTTDTKAVAVLAAEQRAQRRADKAAGIKPERPTRGATPSRAAAKAAAAKAGKTTIESGRYTPKKAAPKKRPTPPPAEPKPSRFKKLIGDEE
jgi:hypothetical protein